MQAASLVFLGVDGKVMRNAIGSASIDGLIEEARKISKRGVVNIDGSDIKVSGGMVHASWQIAPAYTFRVRDDVQPAPVMTAGDKPRKIGR